MRYALARKTSFESFARSMCYAIDSSRFFLVAFFLQNNFQNNFQKLCTPPRYFQNLIFFLKTLEIGKCLQRQQNALVLNASPIFRRKFRWILTSSAWARVIGRITDVAFRYLALSSRTCEAHYYPQASYFILHSLKLECIFSSLFSVHFLRNRHRELV